MVGKGAGMASHHLTTQEHARRKVRHVGRRLRQEVCRYRLLCYYAFLRHPKASLVACNGRQDKKISSDRSLWPVLHLASFVLTSSQVAVVTGAAGTLGESITGMLLSEGYVVAALDIRAEGLSAFKATLDKKSDQYHAFAVDISSASAVEEVCRTILTRLGAVSVLINNAGLLSNHKCVQTSLTEWHRVMHVNVDGAFLLSQQLLPCMRSMHFGRIVNITSMAAKTGGVTAGTAYAVSKGALASLTFSLARETVGSPSIQ